MCQAAGGGTVPSGTGALGGEAEPSPAKMDQRTPGQHSGDPKPQEGLGSAGGGERSRGEGALLPLCDGVIEGGQEQ